LSTKRTQLANNRSQLGIS